MNKKQYEWVSNLIPEYREFIDVWISSYSKPPQKIDQYDRLILQTIKQEITTASVWWWIELGLYSLLVREFMSTYGA